MLFLFFAAAVAPQILLFMNVRKAALFRLAPSQLVWPWAAIARLMLRQPVALSAGVSLLYLAVAYFFGRWQFDLSVRYDAASLKRREREVAARGIAETLFRLPSRVLPDPLAALVEKELRTFARIPRFRMAYAMSCIFGIVVFLPALRNPGPTRFSSGMRCL